MLIEMAPNFMTMTDPAPLQFEKRNKKGKKDKSGQQPQPQPFDPVDEYRALLDLTEESRRKENRKGSKLRLKGAGAGAEDSVYSELMAKEQRVLDTVDRVVNDAVDTSRRSSSPLAGMPVHEVAMRTMGALRSLWDDLISARSLEDVLEALRDPSRVVYIGIALVLLAAMLSVVYAMSNSV